MSSNTEAYTEKRQKERRYAHGTASGWHNTALLKAAPLSQACPKHIEEAEFWEDDGIDAAGKLNVR
jgi:hypothetical protein